MCWYSSNEHDQTSQLKEHLTSNDCTKYRLTIYSSDWSGIALFVHFTDSGLLPSPLRARVEDLRRRWRQHPLPDRQSCNRSCFLPSAWIPLLPGPAFSPLHPHTLTKTPVMVLASPSTVSKISYFLVKKQSGVTWLVTMVTGFFLPRMRIIWIFLFCCRAKIIGNSYYLTNLWALFFSLSFPGWFLR